MILVEGHADAVLQTRLAALLQHQLFARLQRASIGELIPQERTRKCRRPPDPWIDLVVFPFNSGRTNQVGRLQQLRAADAPVRFLNRSWHS
jgi:hypothetical protein